MKYSRLLSLAFALSLFVASNGQNWSLERTTRVSATVQSSPAKITLKWIPSSYATSYQVFRRDLGSTDWGTAIANLSAIDSSYEDQDVEANKRYEYLLSSNLTLVEPYSNTGAKVVTNSCIASTIELQPQHFRGTILLLVDARLTPDLDNELKQLRMDLTGDGWNTIMEVIEDTSSVATVANTISSSGDVDMIYILGQVAYPYSGLYCHPDNYEVPPDGHHENAGSHCGAWIADAYYGCLNGSWTDTDSTTIAARAVNRNLIGDGKFDNNVIPGEVTVAVGRVDLSRLPAFSETEIELMQHYLGKVHDYKMDRVSYLRLALMENNFASVKEGFSSAAVRDFYNHLGDGNTINADLFTSTATDRYLFSYVCGPGSMTSCGGVGNTANFVTSSAGMFSQMFGSWFGDYDETNNIGRASLAAPEGGLTSCWSGRPKWLTHGLAIGEPYGYSAIRTQNNNWDYDLSFFQNYAHIALLGDPSLRTSMFAPPTDPTSTLNGPKTVVTLNWTASTASNISGYYVYWSNSELGPYYLLNQTPVSGNSYVHFTPGNGDNYYMIRAERLEETASGSYYNLSQAAHIMVSGVLRTASVVEKDEITFNVYPNPSNGLFRLRMERGPLKEAILLDASGKLVMEFSGLQDASVLDLRSLNAGLYILEIQGQRQRLIKL